MLGKPNYLPLERFRSAGATWSEPLRLERGPLDRPTQDGSGVAQFTPLRQLRPPEVCPLVSHGRLDTGTSALEDTADLDSEVNFHWRHRQDSADCLECRRLFVPLRKGEILAPEHWQESSLRARADTLRGFFAEGATCSNTTFSYYFSLNCRQWIAARSSSRSIGGGQCASVAATSPSSSGPRNISLPQSMASWQSDMSCPCQLEGFR